MVLLFIGLGWGADASIVIAVLDDADSPLPEAHVVMECAGRTTVYTLDREGTPWVTPFGPDDGPCSIRASHPFLVDAQLEASLPMVQSISIRMSPCGYNARDASWHRGRCRRARRRYTDYLRRLAGEDR